HRARSEIVISDHLVGVADDDVGDRMSRPGERRAVAGGIGAERRELAERSVLPGNGALAARSVSYGVVLSRIAEDQVAVGDAAQVAISAPRGIGAERRDLAERAVLPHHAAPADVGGSGILRAGLADDGAARAD